VVDELECRPAIEHIRDMIREGSGADRQLRVWRETKDLKKVVDYMAEETRAGL
jgi:carboxylate-amine ligase